MRKLPSSLIALAFAAMFVSAFAAAHGGAMTDKEKTEKMAACKKMDPAKADDKKMEEPKK